jgi:bla regulator protein BlaR1
MTGLRARGRSIGLAGSLIAHVCLFAMLAGVHWSPLSTVFPTDAMNDTAADAEGRGFTADTPVGGTDGRSGGRNVTVPSGDVRSDMAGVSGISRSPLANAIVTPTAREAVHVSPRLAAHLWESTLIAAVIGVLAWLLRRNSAHLRYWLWLAASIKFLVPFSILVTAGSVLGALLPRTVVIGGSRATAAAVEFIQRPYGVPIWTPTIALPVATSTVDWLVFGAVVAWAMGTIALLALRFMQWRRVRVLLRASLPVTVPHVELPRRVQLRCAPGLLEPGVIGWRRPVLLLPVGIESRLTPSELRAVIAHELCHVERYDNVTAALHMLTEILFWFYPVVWWIGGRLVTERERACDEAVLAEGNDPATYAHAIVNVCAMYAASPLACVAGVTSSNLQQRIETIVGNEPPLRVVGWKKATVALTIAAVLAFPIGYGSLHATPRMTLARPSEPPRVQNAETLAFDAVSVKANRSGLPQAFDRIEGGRYTATNVSLQVLIRLAYEPSPRSRGLEPFEVVGGPSWLTSDRFDISATAGRQVSLNEVRAMLRTLLADRFQVKAHFERRQGQVYRMSLARPGQLGLRLRRSEADCSGPFDPFRGFTPGEKPICGYFGPSPSAPIGSDRAYQALRGLTMGDLATSLYPHLGRRVIDETGLDGFFDGDVEFTAEIMLPPPPSGPNPFDGRTLPSIFSVLPQQLGLKLERGDAPVEILVIDHAEHPSEN